MKREVITDIVTLLLLGLFAYAGIIKLLDERFIASLNETPILNRNANLFRFLIPASELFVCILLVIPRTKLVGFIASLLLMVLFTLYIGSFLFFSTDKPCICGGIISEMGWTEHFIFNVVFTLIALTGVVLESKKRKESAKRIELA